MTELEKFEAEKKENIQKLGENKELVQKGIDFLVSTAPLKYSYNFTWMGRPIIAFPQDMVAMQEIIWDIKPDLIIETGVAHGGSIIYYASLLELIGGNGTVLGIDIDIRKHNRDLIEAHPMMKRIKLLQGSSISDEIKTQVKEIAANHKKILVCLDSNHSHAHVLEELKFYAPLVTVGSYCVVFDTVVEDMRGFDFGTRPWGIGNSPKTAVWEYLKTNDDFVINKGIDGKLLISVAPDGYLKRVK